MLRSEAETYVNRSKTTVYEPKRTNYSIPNRVDTGSAAYHFYLPVSVCHSFCCSPGYSGGLDHWQIPPFLRSAPGVSPGYYFNPEMPLPVPVPNAGWAGTLTPDTPRPIQNRVSHYRSRSGSI
ncbi:hypothetical protein GGS24DRAFT_479257 [Hypoxylon argillaceum]|nr:hypothetical protein GGS24DRAFT_479257 [Hypoxylon argillaceum]